MKKTIYSFLSLILLIGGISCSGGENVANFQTERRTTEKLFLAEWNTVDLPNSELKMKIPFNLNEKYIQVPEQVKSVVKSLKSKDYKLGSDFYILSAATEYTSGGISLTNAANEAMANLKRQRNSSNVSYKEKDIFLAGTPAKFQTGTYREGNRNVEFTNFIILKGARMNSIVITNNAENEYGKKIRVKIEQSIIAN
jgi:hypothetical protein